MWIWILLGTIACTLFIKERLNHRNLRAVFYKVATSICFFLMAWQGLFSCHHLSFGLWILVGLFFGFLGDLWLALKWAYPKQDAMFTFTGFISFALEHFFILMGLVIRTEQPILLMFSLLMAMICSYLVVGMEEKMKLKYGLFKGITLIYGSLLGSIPFYGFFLTVSNNFKAPYPFVCIAGLLFLASDLILSGTYFGKENKRFLFILNHILYFIAQFILAYITWIC